MGYKNDDPCIKKAYDDERLFVLMARDPQAPETIIKWIAHSLGNQPDDKIREALECAIEMQNRGKEFRIRKEDDDLKAAEKKEHDEFEAWKRRQKIGEVLVNAGLAMKRPETIGGIPHDKAFVNEVGGSGLDRHIKETGKAFIERVKNESADIRFAEQFANWLDINPKLIERKEDFKTLFHMFLNYLPTAR
jgi:hypothetical protein